MESASSIARRESPYAVQLELLLQLPDEIRPDQPVQWTDEEIDRLREGLLKHALQVILDDRNAPSTKQEIRLWMESDLCHPFSFRICALEAGVDPDELRASLRYIVRKREKSEKQFFAQRRFVS